METRSRGPPGPMILINSLLLFVFAIPINGLYFYMEGSTPKCFYEELPKDTMVVGHYKAEKFDSSSNSFTTPPDLGIWTTVDEVFDNDHRVVNTKGSSSGQFTFSAADSGDHRICFSATGPVGGGGWLSGGQPMGGIKLSLDLAIGETSQIESTDKSKIADIVTKVKDLNGRLQDIRREQVFQRVRLLGFACVYVCGKGWGLIRCVCQEREAEFRDQSESTNARVVRWTLLQLVVLGITCAWQLSHLRAFFIKQKLT
ncbi:MAG: hypothetical protein Q9183_004259 [Haloplaca sp. 2 TL-2023]